MKSYDVGSLPVEEKDEMFDLGARTYTTLLPLLYTSGNKLVEASKIFEEKSVQVFLDKMNAGIDIPNYAQLRDMNTMFLGALNGIEKKESSYKKVGRISLKQGAAIPELDAIERNASRIGEKSGVDKLEIKVCVTGPYTLASLFDAKDSSLLRELGEAITKILSSAIFSTRDARVSLVAVDEPVFGFISDPVLDYGSEGREALLSSWQDICHTAVSKGVETAFHLHSTSNELFWSVKDLRIVESHVGDPLYTSEFAKKMIEEKDKFLKASICVTDFDRLIIKSLQEKGIDISKEGTQEILAQTWKSIQQGKIDPTSLVESVDLMQKRLRDVINRFGVERVPYAGPECGLKSFPSYESAITCLSRVSQAIKGKPNRAKPTRKR